MQKPILLRALKSGSQIQSELGSLIQITKKPVRVFGGTYDEETETVIVANFIGQANVRLEFKND